MKKIRELNLGFSDAQNYMQRANFGPFDMGHMLLAFVEEEGVAIEFNEFK